MAFPVKDWLGPMIEAEVSTAIEWMKSRETRPNAPSQKGFEDLYEDDGSNLRIKCERGLRDRRLVQMTQLTVNEDDSPDGSLSDGYTVIKAKFDEDVFDEYRKKHSLDIIKAEGALLEIPRFEIVTSLYGASGEDSIQLLVNEMSFAAFPAQHSIGNPKPAHERPKLSGYINSLLREGDATDSEDELLSQGAPDIGFETKPDNCLPAHGHPNEPQEASVISTTQFATQIEIRAMDAPAQEPDVTVMKGVNLARPHGATFARPVTSAPYRRGAQPGSKEDLLKLLQLKRTHTASAHQDGQPPPNEVEGADDPEDAEAGRHPVSPGIDRSVNHSSAHDEPQISVRATQAGQHGIEPDKASPDTDMLRNESVSSFGPGARSERGNLASEQKSTTACWVDSTGIRSATAEEKLNLQPRGQNESHSPEIGRPTDAGFTPLDGGIPTSYQRQPMSQVRHAEKLKSAEPRRRPMNGQWGLMSPITRSMCKISEKQMKLLNPHLPTSWLPPANAVDFPPGNLPIAILTKINKVAEKRARRRDSASARGSDEMDCSDSDIVEEPPSSAAISIPWSPSPEHTKPVDDLPPESSLPEQSGLPVSNETAQAPRSSKLAEDRTRSNLDDTVAVVDESVSGPVYCSDEEIPRPAIEIPSSPPEADNGSMAGDDIAEAAKYPDVEMTGTDHQRRAVENPSPFDTAVDALGGYDAVAGSESDSDIEMAAPHAFTVRSKSKVQIAASSPSVARKVRENSVTRSPAVNASTMHTHGFVRRSGEDTTVSSTPVVLCSIPQTARNPDDKAKIPRSTSNISRPLVAGSLDDDDEAERQIHDEMKRLDVQDGAVPPAPPDRAPKTIDTRRSLPRPQMERKLTPKRRGIELEDRSTSDKVDSWVLSRDPMNNVKSRKRSWMQTAKQSLNSRETPDLEDDPAAPMDVRLEATSNASLARPEVESDGEHNMAQATQLNRREDRQRTTDHVVPQTGGSSMGSQARQASQQSRRETTGPYLSESCAGPNTEMTPTGSVAKPMIHPDREKIIREETQSTRRHTTAHQLPQTYGFDFGSQSHQASQQSRRKTTGPDLSKFGAGPVAEGSHIEARSNGNDVFQTFIDTYPEYVQCKGDLKHFTGLCRMIERLEKEERMQHRSLWDDFIIRHRSDYPKYLLNCNDEGSDPVPYEKFYRQQIEEPLFTKRIMTPATLKRAMEQEHGPSFAKTPSLPGRAETHIPGHVQQNQMVQGPLNQPYGSLSISHGSIQLDHQTRAQYPANLKDDTGRGSLGGDMSRSGIRIPMTYDIQGQASPMPGISKRHQEPQRPQLPRSVQDAANRAQALKSSTIGEASDLGQSSISKQPSIGETRRTHSRTLTVPTAPRAWNAQRHSLPAKPNEPTAPAMPERSRRGKRSLPGDKHEGPTKRPSLARPSSILGPSSSRPVSSAAPGFAGSLTPATNPLPVDKSYQTSSSPLVTPRKRTGSVTSSRASSLKRKNAFTLFKEKYTKGKPK